MEFREKGYATLQRVADITSGNRKFYERSIEVRRSDEAIKSARII